MATAPKVSDYPKILKALSFYKFTSIATGIMLLFVVVEMVAKYAYGYEIYAFSQNGVISLAPVDAFGNTQSDGINLSTGILIVHGWFYVVYLFSNFMLWSPMRWPFWVFLVLASGGIVPLLSFFLEGRIARKVLETIDAGEPEPTPVMEAQH